MSTNKYRHKIAITFQLNPSVLKSLCKTTVASSVRPLLRRHTWVGGRRQPSPALTHLSPLKKGDGNDDDFGSRAVVVSRTGDLYSEPWSISTGRSAQMTQNRVNRPIRLLDKSRES